jgi:hypothetical protein
MQTQTKGHVFARSSANVVAASVFIMILIPAGGNNAQSYADTSLKFFATKHKVLHNRSASFMASSSKYFAKPKDALMLRSFKSYCPSSP